MRNGAYLIFVALVFAVAFGITISKLQSKYPTQALYAPSTAITATYRVTAYCSGPCCCGEYADGITASGHKIKPGDKFIAAPKSIPFGTWINIEGYGYAEVLDRGGAIKGNRLDVYFDTHQEALNWGVRYLEIEL